MRKIITEIPPLVFFVLAFLLSGCSSLSNMFRRGDVTVNNEENQELRRAVDIDGLDPIALEKMRYPQWDSLRMTEIDAPCTDAPVTLADSVISFARQFIACPYVPAGKGPDKFDCSGFTSFVFKHFGYELKSTSDGQLSDGWIEIDDLADLRRGDLVFYGGRKKTRTIGHVGIVVDTDLMHHSFTFIHATVHRGVIISTSTEAYYAPRYITACRILPNT